MCGLVEEEKKLEEKMKKSKKTRKKTEKLRKTGAFHVETQIRKSLCTYRAAPSLKGH